MKVQRVMIATIGLMFVSLEAHAAWSPRYCEQRCTKVRCLAVETLPKDCSSNCSHELLPPECIPGHEPAHPAVQPPQGPLPLLSREEQENLRSRKIDCAKTIPLSKIMEIKSHGYIEYEGNVYEPDNKADFDKNVPANYQFLTAKLKNADLVREYPDPENPPPTTICEYTYKTLERQRYDLVLRVGPAFLHK